jgi:hypothetical protein
MIGTLYLEILSPEKEWKILRTLSYGSGTRDSEENIIEELEDRRHQWSNTVYRNGNFRIVKEMQTGRGVERQIVS